MLDAFRVQKCDVATGGKFCGQVRLFRSLVTTLSSMLALSRVAVTKIMRLFDIFGIRFF